jgi:hypothetical protein
MKDEVKSIGAHSTKAYFEISLVPKFKYFEAIFCC